jgi:flavodoxin
LLGLGGVTSALAGCTSPDSPPPAGTPTPDATPTGGETPVTGRILLAYFSRAGENYYYGGRRDLEVGNTEVLARMIADLIDVDIFEIEAADPYSDNYDATVARNVREQDSDARPEIANPLADISGYDTVLIGSPIWNVRPPMIMNTFAESQDFTGKQIHPFVTYAVSGLGNTADVYATAFPDSRIGPGLAVQGEEVAQHRDDVETWLREAGLT